VPDLERDSLAAEVRHDPVSALFAGPEGLDTIRRFVPQAAEKLSPRGLLAMEIGADQGAQVVALATEAGLQAVRLAEDLSGNPRFVFAQSTASP
ncbi:MAG: peptide chain release factor N(5)-glutamine methyltransferase, partial [Akkermansiaceae bacterium]|nr:peptide chain release factor N(5)-glutamine methyltransferase [Akkermansiaceae bacterium]